MSSLLSSVRILNKAIDDKRLDINKKFINDRASFVSVVVFYCTTYTDNDSLDLFKTLLAHDADLENVCSIGDKDQVNSQNRPPLIRSIYDRLEYLDSKHEVDEKREIPIKLLSEIVKNDQYKKQLIQSLDQAEQAKLFLDFSDSFPSDQVKLCIQNLTEDDIRKILNKTNVKQTDMISFILDMKPDFYKLIADYAIKNTSNKIVEYLIENYSKLDEDNFAIIMNVVLQHKNQTSAKIIEKLIQNNSNIINDYNWELILDIGLKNNNKNIIDTLFDESNRPVDYKKHIIRSLQNYYQSRAIAEKLISYIPAFDDLFRYIETGKKHEIEDIVNNNPEFLLVKNIDGYTPLHYAVLLEKLDIVEYLSDANSEVTKIKDKNGNTALHIATDKGYSKIVKILVQKNNDAIKVQDGYGNTALHIATNKDYSEIVEILAKENNAAIKITDRSGRTAIHYAVEKGYTKIVKILAEANSSAIKVKDKNEKTAINLAVERGCINIVEYLAAKNPEEYKVIIPILIDAIKKGNSYKVKMLANINHDAIKEQYIFSKTPLHFAVNKGDFDIVEFLAKINHDAIIVEDHIGKNPLHDAARAGNLAIVTILGNIKPEAIIRTDHVGNNPLHDAARAGNLEIMKYLAHSNITAIEKINKDNMTPLDIAYHHLDKNQYKSFCMDLTDKLKSIDEKIKEKTIIYAAHASIEKMCKSAMSPMDLAIFDIYNEEKIAEYKVDIKNKDKDQIDNIMIFLEALGDVSQQLSLIKNINQNRESSLDKQSRKLLSQIEEKLEGIQEIKEETLNIYSVSNNIKKSYVKNKNPRKRFRSI